jgi:hypothetical protein
MIIKERIQKADGTIKYRNYLKQDKLGKGKFVLICKVVLPNAFWFSEWKTKKITHSRLFLKSYSPNLRPDKKYLFCLAKMLSEIKIHRTSKHKNIC